MATNRQKLRDLMHDHSLSYQGVADLVSKGKLSTVRSWLYPSSSKAHRAMPDTKLELLKLKLEK